MPNNTLNSIFQKEPIPCPYNCEFGSGLMYKYLSCLPFYSEDKNTYLRSDKNPIEIRNLCDWSKRN